MKKINRILLASLLLMGVSTKVFADSINIAGNNWEYAYTATQEFGFVTEAFTVFFDVNLYKNLFAAGTPAGWNPPVIQSDTLLPDDGAYDVLALLVSGVATGVILKKLSILHGSQRTNSRL
jgi:hypothetical protein